MLDLRGELTDLIHGCSDAVLSLSRGSSPPLDDHSYSEVEHQSMPDAIGSLEDTLGQQQYHKAVQMLHTVRKQWKGEEGLGASEDDDVDCLFFIYARYVADRQGMCVCVWYEENRNAAMEPRPCTYDHLTGQHHSFLASN